MAKQFIIAAMEEVFGEYILNMSKENLKIAALRGKIKLENVQLDGDLIGGHVMGVLGLSGFGILSCFAKSINISVPWKQLEREPTRFEVKGVHLVCVPLVPSTANQMYGAGTKSDPRCSLRTRAKRLLLARMERNFWNGQIPGEGPPMKRVTRAVKEVERDLRRTKRKRVAAANRAGFYSEEAEMEEAFDNLVYNLNDSMAAVATAGAETSFRSEEEKSSKDTYTFSTTELPELPRDWKVKLREKVLRNMEASVHDVHIRCEVSKGRLDNTHHQKNIEDRAFALGFTLESFVVRTANEQWQVGSHDKDHGRHAASPPSAATRDHLGPNGYIVKNNKIGFLNSVSIYWDDEPPMLLADTDLFRGNYRKLSSEKLQSRIASAMDAMFLKQEPGRSVRHALSMPVPNDMNTEKCHEYICQSLNAEVRARTSDRAEPGPISASADILPFDFTINIRPHQYVHYQKLRNAIKSQQRFDTMLRQRPAESPLVDARAWWHYAMACVTSRPNSRPWEDVKVIVQNRPRYIELVAKKNRKSLESNSSSGYHGGLSEKESTELLAIEDLLPIEALDAFHLLALRQVYEASQKGSSSSAAAGVASLEGGGQLASHSNSEDSGVRTHRSKSSSGRFRLLVSGSSSSTRRGRAYSELDDDDESVNDSSSHHRHRRSSSAFGGSEGFSFRVDEDSNTASATANATGTALGTNATAGVSLFEAMTLRLGKKVWYIDWKLHDATINLVFLGGSKGDKPLAHAILRGSGGARSFGKGKRDFSLELEKLDVFHRGEKVLYLKESDDDQMFEDENHDADGWESDVSVGPDDTVASTLSGDNSVETAGPDLATASRFLPLPSAGLVCRIAAAQDFGTTKFSISAHPATLIWTTALFDSLSEFYHTRLPASAQDDLVEHIRNAATPLARKAQLALLSPASMALHLNISAPKIWVPIASYNAGGSLFLDAGTLRVAGLKDEGEPNMNWDVQARDIRMNFVRGRCLAFGGDELQLSLLSQLIEATARTETCIVSPFHVSIEARNQVCTGTDGLLCLTEDTSQLCSARSISVIVSPVSLNLVDAEALARAFGKWYARGLHRVKRRVSIRGTGVVNDKRMSATATNTSGDNNSTSHQPLLDLSAVPRILSVTLDRVEIALEGHSKSSSNSTNTAALDERSLASQDSFHEVAPATRTYLVEVSDITIWQSRRGDLSTAQLTVGNAEISRLRDGSHYTPLRANSGRSVVNESQYCILVRATENETEQQQQEAGVSNSNSSSEETQSSEILRASLIHDGKAHLDEVEVDIDSVVLRVTPTTLKDCAKAFRRVAELTQLMTREMERKVHEEGRKARRRVTDTLDGDNPSASADRPASPSTSEPVTEATTSNQSQSSSYDSSIIFKVTLRESTLLAGRPTTAIERLPFHRDQAVTFAVVQVLSNALIMFQSIENPDSTGSKTLHVSVDNVSSLVNTSFERVSPTQSKPMIGPTGAEFRVVYGTEEFGCVVSQDISLDFEAVKSCLTPNDLSIMINICSKMFERLRAFGSQATPSSSSNSSGGNNGKTVTRKLGPLSSLIRYQKRGTGIATRVRAEVQAFSFVLLRAYKSLVGAPEFLDFNVQNLKGKLEGCMSALSGDCSATLSVNFFNAEGRDWEYAIEPFPFTVAIDQMPNELVMNVCSDKQVHLNLTGVLLRDFAEMKFDILRDRRRTETETGSTLTPSALRTVGLRRATEARSIKVTNRTGFDIHVGLVEELAAMDTDDEEEEAVGLVCNQSNRSFETTKCSYDHDVDEEISMCMRLAASETQHVGEREPVFNLKVPSSANSQVVYLLRPVATFETESPTARATASNHLLRLIEGRTSPATCMSDDATSAGGDKPSYHSAEPVVEWCMHNQRLRASTTDLYSLPKGQDLLSSSVWSPEDRIVDHNLEILNTSLATALNTTEDDQNENAVAAGLTPADTLANQRRVIVKKSSNWIRPYLKNDVPEWTDMTCTLRMARERVTLPDERWIWVSDWAVDLSGKLGKSTDADGWEYSADFETFTRSRRYYQRGDACRRRRWTRTRIVLPPRLDDPLRQLKFVWETSKDENGNYQVLVRSHVRVRNVTAVPVSCFCYSPSWDDDMYIGTVEPNGKDFLCVPVNLATSAVYMRLAKRKESSCAAGGAPLRGSSERFPILPTSHTSSHVVRTSMHLEDVSATTLHFLVEITSNHGIVDITIQPVLRLINLLPCQLEVQFGEVMGKNDTRTPDKRGILGATRTHTKRIANCETLCVASGKEGAFTAISPWRMPHVSLRVPGYEWSKWHRIVNRNGSTWRPCESEEDWHFKCESSSSSTTNEELKTIVRFCRAGHYGNNIGAGGDPLNLVLSVECDHCPTLRVYSQYWIVDKTGFGCRFSEGFSDLLGSVPDLDTSRRSHLCDAKNAAIRRDMVIPGHQWSIGMSGMSLYFSTRERLTLAIETGVRDRGGGNNHRSKSSSSSPSSSSNNNTNGGGAIKVKSKWVSPLDISNVMPKTVFYVDELNGPRRFELAISVTLCPGLFSRTKLITLLPRYQIVNLLHRELVICQDGTTTSGRRKQQQHGCETTLLPSQSAVPFHWERASLPPKVRLGAPTPEERGRGEFSSCWTNGRFQLDRVGITSMRLPTDNKFSNVPLVVQAEVRLATKEQSSAVVVVIWAANEKSNPLYVLRNRTPYTILCRQPLSEDGCEADNDSNNDNSGAFGAFDCSSGGKSAAECSNSEIGPMIQSFLGLERPEEFVWVLKSNEVVCFGFDDPEKPHLLEWTYTAAAQGSSFGGGSKRAYLQVDAMGSASTLSLPGGRRVRCQIEAEHSTKVIEFQDFGFKYAAPRPAAAALHISETQQQPDEEEDPGFSLRLELPGVSLSVVDNVDPNSFGREIMLAQLERIYFSFSQTREGYHELEFRLNSLQVDNHVHKSIHPVLIFCPRINHQEPLIHMSAVRRLQKHSNTYVFRYAALRILEVEIYLDRRTAECVARFIEPLKTLQEEDDNATNDNQYHHDHWVSRLTASMGRKFAQPDRNAPREIEKMIHTANSGRIYFEQLHLHPVRLSLTFTQEWISDWNPGSETVMLFQFIRGMASIANAPLVFTSFVVGHVFESPSALSRVIATHYSSQLTKQIFGILGSLAILGAPADFISNVGTGVRDFFYEPIQGAVHGPKQFIEGLEAGTFSLARGVFVGVVRGAANVTEVVNSNLAGLTADDDFIDERKAHQRLLTDAMSRRVGSNRSFGDSLALAGASVMRGFKSGAMGIVEQPAIYASKHGPVGFVKGVGKAIVGALVKPVVGVGDAAVLVMNHMSDATSKKQVLPKIPKRLRRALPCRNVVDKTKCGVRLVPYDERAAKAQKIVTGGESVDDVYLGHINIPSHLIIASFECLWAIDKRSRDPWCVSWEEISHFGLLDGSSAIRVVVFSQTGLKTYVFDVDNPEEAAQVNELLTMQIGKMGNSSELNSSLLNAEPESLSRHRIPGIKAPQVNHVFGSCNLSRKRVSPLVKDEIDLVEQCFTRVRAMGSDSSTFFRSLDQEAWSLVSAWGQVFSGLSSRRCIVASVINGTGNSIQIKSTKLVEGGSPCYSIPTREFDPEQGILHPGGVIIFFGWGVVPNLLQAGHVFMHIETSAFIGDLADHKSRETYAEAMPGYQVGFLEKSYDDSGCWWAKYWLLARAKH